MLDQIASANVRIRVYRIRLFRGNNIGFQPLLQPCADLHVAQFPVGAFIHLGGDLRQLLAHFLLGFAVDIFLLLFSGFRIETESVATFPPPIGALSDQAGPSGVSL